MRQVLKVGDVEEERVEGKSEARARQTHVMTFLPTQLYADCARTDRVLRAKCLSSNREAEWSSLGPRKPKAGCVAVVGGVSR